MAAEVPKPLERSATETGHLGNLGATTSAVPSSSEDDPGEELFTDIMSVDFLGFQFGALVPQRFALPCSRHSRKWQDRKAATQFFRFARKIGLRGDDGAASSKKGPDVCHPRLAAQRQWHPVRLAAARLCI
eukprot:SAG11_NODE_15157_length_587_cov_1.006148_1_plen_130_part_10